jgi:nucleotide-binding universal stress UspA family protein
MATPGDLEDRRMMTMAKRILAPIDPRDPGGQIVQVLGALARDSGATLRLLRVMPVPERVVDPHGWTVAYADQEMERLTAVGRDDLQRLEDELGDITVESVVRFGKPVEEILLEAEAFDADLIALSGAARGRLRRFFARGVADGVVDRALVPTLVLRG